MPKASPRTSKGGSASSPRTASSGAKKRSKAPFVLNHKTYYSPDRPHISNSQISDYLLSPNYYWRRHVAKNLKASDPTPAMAKGLLVDSMLTGSVPRDLKLSDKAREEVKEIVEKIESTDLWREQLRPARKQVILTGSIDGTPICGMADFILTDGAIVDLKVTSHMKMGTAAKWSYNVRDMGYARQLALYAFMASGSPNGVPCYNLAVAHHRPGVVLCHLYRFPEHALRAGFDEARAALKRIRQLDFLEPKLTYDSAELLPDLSAPYRGGGGGNDPFPDYVPVSGREVVPLPPEPDLPDDAEA